MGTDLTKNKKICIITTAHPPFDRRVFHKEAKTLSAAGFDVSLITQNEKDETVDNVRILAIPKVSGRIMRMATEGFFAVRRALSEKFDLYHFHDPELILWMLVLKAITKKPVIFDMHEIYTDIIINNSIIRNQPLPFRNAVSSLYACLEKCALPFFDSIIVTENQQKILYSRYNPVIISNYPILNYFGKKTEKPDTDGNRIVIYCGALTKTYGILQIVSAIDLLSPSYKVKLRLVGSLPYKSFESELRSRVKGKRNIEIIKEVPHNKVAEYLETAEIGLLCNLPLKMNMHMGANKMYEYMAVGLPIIASDFPVWKEFIEKNDCGICANPLDPKDIADKIMFLLDNPQICKRMGENGRKAVQEHYNWSSEGKKLVALYKKLLHID